MKKIYACFLAFVILLSFVAHAQTIRPEFPITNERVNTIIKYNGTIYIGGSFTSITDPQTGIAYDRNHLAAFDAVTGAILPWNPPVASDSYLFVTTLAAGNNVIYAGGFFGVSGQPELEDLVALDPITGAVLNWYPDLKNYGSKTIQKIVVAESKVFIAGAFVNSSSGELENVLAFNAVSGQRISEFRNLSNNVASTMVVKDDHLYIGGSFTSLNSLERQNIAALDATDGTVLPYNPAADGNVRSLKIKDNTLYAAGSFTGFGYNPVNKTVAVQRNGVAALDVNTGAVLSWNPNVTGSVAVITVDGKNVYIGGSFTKVGNGTRNNIAIVEAISGGLSLWNPNANGSVNDILVDGNTIFVGGQFTSIAGQPRSFFAALTAPISPVVTCPANIIVSNAPNSCGQLVSFAATATGSPLPTIIYHLGLKEITSPYNFPIGTSTVEVVAGNNIGASHCSFTVTVNDTEAPTITNLSATPDKLWPPDNKMKNVSVDYTVTDNCPETITTNLSVTSNEPANGREPDWIVTDNHHVQLRAERSGKSDGRIYTITVTATDHYGNTSSRSITVTVPHSQSEKENLHGPDKFKQYHEIRIKAQPNPSRSYFMITVQSDITTQKINLKLYDVNGHLLETKNNLAAGQPVQMGKTLRAGFYILECGQGAKIKQIKLIKQ